MSFSTPKQTRARATRGHEIQFRTLRRSLAFKYILSNPSLLFGPFLETILERGAASFREPHWGTTILETIIEIENILENVYRRTHKFERRGIDFTRFSDRRTDCSNKKSSTYILFLWIDLSVCPVKELYMDYSIDFHTLDKCSEAVHMVGQYLSAVSSHRVQTSQDTPQLSVYHSHG